MNEGSKLKYHHDDDDKYDTNDNSDSEKWAIFHSQHNYDCSVNENIKQQPKKKIKHIMEIVCKYHQTLREKVTDKKKNCVCGTI